MLKDLRPINYERVSQEPLHASVTVVYFTSVSLYCSLYSLVEPKWRAGYEVESGAANGEALHSTYFDKPTNLTNQTAYHLLFNISSLLICNNLHLTWSKSFAWICIPLLLGHLPYLIKVGTHSLA
jgi:hypothetical protein